MKQVILLIFTGILLISCTDEKSKGNNASETTSENTTIIEENKRSEQDTIKSTAESFSTKEKKGKTEVIDGVFYEYYPGPGKKVRFQGPQDKDAKRDGKWIYFSEDGIELSVTNYHHGKRNGSTLVKYPNGNIHYIGEYRDDKIVGVWTTYSIEGEQLNKKDYGNL